MGGALLCSIGILVPVARPPVNPPLQAAHSIEARQQVPPEVSATLRRACYDCHSNETRWPWYSRVPPASLLIAKDVEAARAVLNFSEWPDSGVNAAGLLMAACADAGAGLMPMPRYLKLHPEAKLSSGEVDRICAWTEDEARRLLTATDPKR